MGFFAGRKRRGSQVQGTSPEQFSERRWRRAALARGLCLEVLEARVLPSFVAQRSYDAGNEPRSVAVGDFNSDGIPDLAVANSFGPVSVLLGNGDGSFRPAVNYNDAVSGPASVAVGDFTGDGLLDLAVTNQRGNTVSVLLGNGDGSFQAPRTFAAGLDPQSVAVGDFNGDGKLDLAVADYAPLGVSGTVSVLLGNGDGSFQAARTFAAGIGPRSVAVGDFNADGKLDLAVVGYGEECLNGYCYPHSDETVRVLLGNGDGSFRPAVSYAAGGGPVSVAVGDFNGDDAPDLAVADAGDLQGNGAGVSVLLGNGDGSFQAARTFAAGLGPRSVAVGDFNGDGHLDLAVANYSGSNVSVLLGSGDGSFRPGVSYATGSRPVSVAVGDFNGDGHLDLAVANYSGDSVSVLLGSGDGTFQASPSYFAGTQPRSVAVGDFTGAGIPDLAVADAGDSLGRGEGVSVLLGNGDGTFQAGHTYAAGPGPESVAVGDFNGDGILDLVVANGGSNNNNVSVLLGNGDGTFQAARSFAAGVSPSSVAVADFNDDGILDLAVANNTIQGTVSVLLGNGNGTFQAPRTYAAGTDPVSVAVGDFTGADIPDLAVVDEGDSQGRGEGVSVLLGNGDGTFQAQRTFSAGGNPVEVAVGDFNGDGLLDLAVANDYVGAGLSVLLGNGNGTFQSAQTVAAGGLALSVAVGDFNGDNIPDLAVAGFHGTRVLLGNGDGSFQTTNFSYITGTSTAIAVGDFNADGLPDLAVTDRNTNSVVILTNDGIWNGPAPRGGRPPGRNVAPLGSTMVSPPLPDTRLTDPSPSLDLRANPERPRPTPEVTAGISTASELVSAPRSVATLRPARAAEVLDVGWGLPDWRSGAVGTW
jgi:hypothetical protein